MKPIRIVITLVILLGLSYSSVAHIADTCLVVIEQTSTNLKRCVSNIGDQSQCLTHRLKLINQINECSQQQFPQISITEAIRNGEAMTQGSFSFYLGEDQFIYGTTDSLRSNEHNFAIQFGNSSSAIAPSGMSDNLNAGGCKNAFLGDGRHYVYAGGVSMKRFALGDDDYGNKPVKTKLHYFIKMQKGQCYPIPQEIDKDSNEEYTVTNIPESFVSHLKSQSNEFGTRNNIMICESELMCKEFKRDHLTHQVDYQAANLKYRRLRHCAELSQQNNPMSRLMRFQMDEKPLPAHCPTSGLRDDIRKQEQIMHELEKKLFRQESALTLKANNG